MNWVLFDGRSLASSRLQGHAIHDFLVRQGLPSRLLSTPPFPLRDAPWNARSIERAADLVAGEIVVLQKLAGPRTERLVDALRAREVSVVYAAADLEPDNELPRRCDVVVCSSRMLTEHWGRAGANAQYVPEPADFWCERARLAEVPPVRDRLRLCWLGHRKNWETLVPLRRLLDQLPGFYLVTVSNHPDADVQWTLATAETELRAADAVVVPTRADPLAQYASANRVVQAMAAGTPVVAGRIDAYERLIENGETGYLCGSDEEWRSALIALRDPERRRDLARRAWERVRQEFDVQAIGELWLQLFSALSPAAAKQTSPLADVWVARLRAAAHAEYAREALERDLGLRAVAREAAHAPLAPAAAVSVIGRAVARAVGRRLRSR